ncbi:MULTISPECIES: hypothetical protein [Pseudomonas]|nr:hypothetical protein [Pseudomonas sp. 17103552]
MNIYPAPWSISAFQSQCVTRVIEIRDALGSCVATMLDEDTATKIVGCRNASSDIDGVNAIRSAFQGAIDALNSDINGIRERWHEEVSDLNRQIAQYREQIKAYRDGKEDHA